MVDHFLECPICLEIATEAVESCCCSKILCSRCSSPLRTCPCCRAEPFQVRESTLGRRMIASLPLQCQHCSTMTSRGELTSHLNSCVRVPRQCASKGCTFSGPLDEFLRHLTSSHSTELLSRYDSTYQNNPKTPEPKPQVEILDPIVERINSNGLRARLGKSGKYYCTGPLGDKCGCCNGSCGPTTGCNCCACMQLDKEVRRLGRGFWVNNDGAICRFSGDRLYCGRKMNIPRTDGYCGPTSGNNCEACTTLQQQIPTRYRALQ